MIFQTINLIVQNNTLYVYYEGSEGVHSDLFDTLKERKKIEMELVAGGPTLGMAVTKEANLEGKQFHITLKTRPPKKVCKPNFDRGYIQVELLDANGNPIPGFTRSDCPQLSGDYKALLVNGLAEIKPRRRQRKISFT